MYMYQVREEQVAMCTEIRDSDRTSDSFCLRQAYYKNKYM